MTYLVKSEHPFVSKYYSTVFSEDDNKVYNPPEVLKIVFIPEGLTPLDIYEAELLKNGYSAKDAKEIIEGLKDSPLYESKTS